MHKGHDKYCLQLNSSLGLSHIQTAVYMWPGHIIPHTDCSTSPPSGSFMSHSSATPNFQKWLSPRSPGTPISSARWMTFKTEPLGIIQTSEHQVAFFANNDCPTLEPQCPSLYAQERMLLLSQWKDCPACLISHWVRACDANRPHSTHLGMKQLLASFEALPLTDPVIFIS